jgi:hypothetical protein
MFVFILIHLEIVWHGLEILTEMQTEGWVISSMKSCRLKQTNMSWYFMLNQSYKAEDI